jgi:CRISPR-associated protein Csd1
VVCLYGKDAGNDKTKAKHHFFIQLLEESGEQIHELASAAGALKDENTLSAIQGRLAEVKARPTDKITIKVGDVFLPDSKDWHSWWDAFRGQLSATGSAVGKHPSKAKGMRCFASGGLVNPAPTHPKISGLMDVGGLSTKDVLLGFDKEAFQSYGLEQALNAAVSEEAATAYRDALDHIIQHQSHRLAGARFAYWFKEDVKADDDPLAWLIELESPEQKERDALVQAKQLMRFISEGRRPDLSGNTYCALTLSGAAGRVMVRDWMDGPFEELAGNVAQWFDDLSITGHDGKALAKSPKFIAVLGCTVRELNDIPAPFSTQMWKAAVKGDPLPAAALSKTLLRVRSKILTDEAVYPSAFGLLKACLLRQARRKGEHAVENDLKPYLNPNHPDPAYHCGRLMAVLASLQKAALGDVGAGVVQRYYAAASTTPALVLGRLVRTGQFHLGKLEPGLAHWFDDQMAAIWSRIKDQIPPTLTLEKQSLFALGYYQQIAQRVKGETDSSNNEKEAAHE